MLLLNIVFQCYFVSLYSEGWCLCKGILQYTKKGKNIDPPLPYSIMRMTCSRCPIIANDMSGNARIAQLTKHRSTLNFKKEAILKKH